ncbi:MAG: hypothetical protein FWH14_03735 [Oscillospiraceae bacterium]|nr:hypothetical protein [Oscillospiraceae bacterium]
MRTLQGLEISSPLPSFVKRVPPQRRGFFLWQPQIPCVSLALPLGELSAATPTERAGRVCTPVHTVSIMA